MGLRLYACLLLSLPYSTCAAHRTTVEFYATEGYRFSPAEREIIQTIADTTALEVERVLPTLPQHLVLKVRAGKKVIPETGETGELAPPQTVYWTVDPNRDIGEIVQTKLRPTLFYEWHQLVRAQTLGGSSLMDHVIAQGLATAFTRDAAGVAVPWGQYPESVSAWVNELIALPPTAPVDQWLYRHPDGRRWIGMKVGTYLVDRATKSSGRSAAQLVGTSTDEILRLAGIK
jgi:hypothetical protein